MSKTSGSTNRDRGRGAVVVEDGAPSAVTTLTEAEENRPENWSRIEETLAALRGPQPSSAQLAASLASTTEVPVPELLSNEEFDQALQAADPPARQQLVQDRNRALQYRLDQLDAAPVQVESGQWTGPDELHPPFSAGEFQAAFAQALPLGQGQNPPRKGKIAGTEYLIQDVQYRHTGGVWGNDGWVHPKNPSRYETSSNAAATAIAAELGLGDHVMPSYAVYVNGHHFDVSQVAQGTQNLGDVIFYDEHGGIGNPHAIPREQIQPLLLYEYLVSDSNRHLGNYQVDPSSGRLVEANFGHSFRYNGNEFRASPLLQIYRGQNPDLGSAALDKGLIQSFVDHRQAVHGIMQQHNLSQGAVGVDQRFAHLESLLQKSGDVQVTDLGLKFY